VGRDEEAIKYYEAARRIDPNNAIAEHRLLDLINAPASTRRRVGRTTAVAVARN